ncbi:MAG: hypothetical protein FJ087_03835 [Deltaproteobacteria bacterium]|nr:hypothetical protein [Deltaproteobacteria bacterium]
MRRALPIVVFLAIQAALVLLGTGCSRPCDRLADRTCGRHGAATQACLDVKNLAARSGDEDQAHCREALAILEALPAGTRGAK